MSDDNPTTDSRPPLIPPGPGAPPSIGFFLRVTGPPPTKANTYQIVRTPSGTRLAKHPAARVYEEGVLRQCLTLAAQLRLPCPAITGPVTLMITYHQGNRRRRDLSNIAKAIEDAVTRSRLWQDDSLVERILLDRRYDAPSRGDEWVDVMILPDPPGMSPGH